MAACHSTSPAAANSSGDGAPADTSSASMTDAAPWLTSSDAADGDAVLDGSAAGDIDGAIRVIDSGTRTSALPQECGSRPHDGVCAHDGLDCNYPNGASCRCQMSSCFTPAGPVPSCRPSEQWVCRNDGCPMTLIGACAREGQRCGADDGMCLQNYACLHGKWREQGHPMCRPAAPH